LVITDVDNTLFDWLKTWEQSFTYLIGHISEITGVDVATLIWESRRIHRCHGTSEYRFLIRSLASLVTGSSPEKVTGQFSETISTWLNIRDRNAVLYPGVADSLRLIRASGCAVAAYTESLRYYALRVANRTGLDGLLSSIYVLPDHKTPADITPDELAIYGGSEMALSKTNCTTASPQMRKPDPQILLRIARDFNVGPSETVYVGDGLMKDMLMAQDAGVTDVHATYGDTRDSPAYALLRSVSHWSDGEIERERAITRRDVRPSYSIASFGEILNLFTFGCGTAASSR
jgi:phosphoglycolate phosphatase